METAGPRREPSWADLNWTITLGMALATTPRGVELEDEDMSPWASLAFLGALGGGTRVDMAGEAGGGGMGAGRDMR